MSTLFRLSKIILTDKRDQSPYSQTYLTTRWQDSGFWPHLGQNCQCQVLHLWKQCPLTFVCRPQPLLMEGGWGKPLEGEVSQLTDLEIMS